MSTIRRRECLVRGGAMLAGLAAIPAFAKAAISDRRELAEHEHNPHIRHAIEALREARDEIEGAHHDFHGHKHEAMEAIDHALQHLEEIKDFEH